MKVFVTGATGAIGRFAVPELVAAGHQVIGLARSDEKAAQLEQQGAAAARVSMFDEAALKDAFAGCDAVCNLGGSTMKSHSVMTLTGDTQYRTEAHATFDPPMAGQAVTDTVIEGRYVGACKPGQQPGDMTLPTGQTMNIRNIMNGKK